MSRIRTRRERRRDERDRERWLDEEARERRHREMMEALKSRRDRSNNIRDHHLPRPPRRHVVRPPKPPPSPQPTLNDLGCIILPFVLLFIGARELDRTLEKQRREREKYLRRTARLQTFLAYSRTGAVFSASETERLAYLYLLALYHMTDYKMREIKTADVEHRLRQIVEWPNGASHRSKWWLVRHLRAFRKVDSHGWSINWSDIRPPIPELPDDPAAAGEVVKRFIRQFSSSAKRW